MTTNFLGIPVEGDITKGGSRVEQRPIEELQPIMQAVLDDPTIVEFGWRQYTPYFNDGETCVFSACGLWVRTDADTDVDDLYELEVYGHRSLGKVGGGFVENPDDPGGPKVWQPTPYEGPDEARYLRCKELETAVEGGPFENVLLDAFGDHANVTVRRDGIQVEFYDHD